MAIEYPDILGDLVEARQRWEVDGVQYQARFDPETVAAGQVSHLSIFLQSAVDSPIEFSLSLEVPKVPKQSQGFSVAESQISLPLQPGEVGELTIPTKVGEIPAGIYPFRLNLRGKSLRRGQRVRSPRSAGRVPPTLPIKDWTGLNLASTIGVGYTAKTENRPVLKLKVQGQPEIAEEDLAPVYQERWKVEDIDLLVRATRDMGDRRLHIIKPLNRSLLFTAMINETSQRFSDLGIRLALGEAIFVAKALTGTIEIFLSSESLQDGLYVPILQSLLASDTPIHSPAWLLMKPGYGRVLNLAIALSFGMLEDYRKKRTWPIAEQYAVRQFIMTQMTNQQPLPIDLVYVPLILGGLLLARKIVVEGEDIAASLAALRKARDIRLTELAQGDDEIVQILDELLAAS